MLKLLISLTSLCCLRRSSAISFYDPWMVFMPKLHIFYLRCNYFSVIIKFHLSHYINIFKYLRDDNCSLENWYYPSIQLVKQMTDIRKVKQLLSYYYSVI